jgi:hypothetical protein
MKTMTRKAYEKRMKKHALSFERLHRNIIIDTNKFANHPKDYPYYSLPRDIDVMLDSMAILAGWTADTLIQDDRRTMGKAIRKALGYVIP